MSKSKGDRTKPSRIHRQVEQATQGEASKPTGGAWLLPLVDALYRRILYPRRPAMFASNSYSFPAFLTAFCGVAEHQLQVSGGGLDD